MSSVSAARAWNERMRGSFSLYSSAKRSPRPALRDGADALGYPAALAREVALQRIVVAVLPEPEVEQRAAEPARDLRRTLRLINRELADLRVARRNYRCPLAPRKQVRDDRDAGQLVLAEQGADLGGVVGRDVPAADELGARDAGNRRRERDHLALGIACLQPVGETVAGVAEIAEDDGKRWGFMERGEGAGKTRPGGRRAPGAVPAGSLIG